MRTSAALVTALTVTALLLLSATDALVFASTIGITDSSGTVCGILVSSSPSSIQCATPRSSLPLPALPNVSFNSLSGSRPFLCRLRYGGLGLFCWNASSSAVTRMHLYSSPVVLSEVSIGVDHVAVVENNDSGVGFWRGSSNGFPQFVPGVFRSLMSGRGFSYDLDVSSSVRCWRQAGGAVERSFASVSMSSIVTGVDNEKVS